MVIVILMHMICVTYHSCVLCVFYLCVFYVGALERQDKLKEIGVQKILQELISSDDHILYEK